MVVDRLEKLDLLGVLLFKPQKYMNSSGVELKKFLKKYPQIEFKDIYVVHDDLDIPVGKYKISEKGPKDHRGLNNIYEQVGRGFWHVRIGVDAPRTRGKESASMSGEEFVLTNFRLTEKEVLEKVMDEVVQELIK